MPPDPDNIAAAYADAFAGETVAVAKDMMGQLLATFAEKDATIAAQAEAIRLLRSALQNVQLALSLHRDGKHIILSSHGLLSLEEVKYLVVDEALSTTAPKEPSDA